MVAIQKGINLNKSQFKPILSNLVSYFLKSLTNIFSISTTFYQIVKHIYILIMIYNLLI